MLGKRGSAHSCRPRGTRQQLALPTCLVDHHSAGYQLDITASNDVEAVVFVADDLQQSIVPTRGITAGRRRRAAKLMVQNIMSLAESAFHLHRDQMPRVPSCN